MTPNETTTDTLIAELHGALEQADASRPFADPGLGDDKAVCALTALCLEVRALTLTLLAHSGDALLCEAVPRYRGG